MKKIKGIVWVLVFSTVFLLTQDYLFTTWVPSTSALGFPPWLYWFMSIHVLFILLFYFFSKNFWQDR